MFHSFSYSEPAREIIPKACHVMIFVSLFILVLFQVLATSPARGGGARPIISSSFCFLFLYFSLFKDYCFQTGGSLAYASTTTPLEIGMSERVGKTLVAIARRMLADSGLPKFLRGELLFTAACSLRTKCYKERSQICDFFESLVPGPSCTLRPTPNA